MLKFKMFKKNEGSTKYQVLHLKMRLPRFYVSHELV